MNFYIKKGDKKLREDLKNFKEFKDDNFYILLTENKISGYAAFDMKDGYALIYDIECEETDEKIFDALLRAVAFYATQRMVQFTLYDGENNVLRERMLNSIFKEYEEKTVLDNIYADSGINKEKGIFVDGVWLFSQKCKGSEA